MKIVGLVCLLIAGILSSANAEGNLESICAKNSGPKAYEAVESSMKDIESSFKSMETDLATAVQNGNGKADQAFAIFCERVETLKKSVKGLTDSVKPCLEPNQRKNIDVAYNIAASVLQFACENSKLLEESILSPDRECFASKLEDVKGCAQELSFGRSILNSNGQQSAIDPPDVLLSKFKLSPETGDCSNVKTFEECTVNAFTQCQDKKFSKIVDSFFKYVNNDLPCENLPKSPRSAASPASIVNVLLLSLIGAITTVL